MTETNYTIDITPTYAESARTCAYVLAMHSGKRPEDFIGGNYWTESRKNHELAVITFSKVQKVVDTLDSVGVDFYTQNQTFRTKVILGARAQATLDQSNS